MNRTNKLTKQQFIQQYQKSLIQEQAALIDLSTTLQHIKQPQLMQIKHYVTEGDLLAAKERQLEFSRVQKHLKQLQQQVDQLNVLLEKNEGEQLRSLLLITQNNLIQARGGWQQANLALEDRYSQLVQQISDSKQKLTELDKMKFSSSATLSSSAAIMNSVIIQQRQQKQKTVNSNLYNTSQPQQLKLIDDELRRINAPLGGWSQQDHEKFWMAFVQNKQSNRRKFLEQVSKEFPTFTLNALIRHDEFCLKFQELNNKKREYILKMKQHREEEKREENLKNMNNSKLELTKPETRQVSDQDREKIRAFRERKQMMAQDDYSKKLQVLSNKQREQNIIRKKAEILRQKRIRQEENKKLLEQEKLNQLNQLNKPDPLKKLEQQKLQQQLKEKQQRDIEQTKRQYQKLVQKKLKEDIIQQKLDQLASQLKPDVERDANALYKRTRAQEARLQDVKEAKEKGKRLGGSVTVGFDPFAVIPIGGLAKPSWM